MLHKHLETFGDIPQANRLITGESVVIGYEKRCH